jgi:O-antigen/teichoic acid export membrane protein
MSHFLNRPRRNVLRWEPAARGELLRFGTWIFLGTIVAFLAGSLDRILLGRLLTLSELGIYSIALTFARVGIEVTTRLSNTVLFPVLARSQDDPVTLVGQSLRARGLILLAGGALVCGFAITAPVFFQLLYDPRYAAAGDIARWLALSVWASIVLSSMERVPLALGHPRALFVSNLVTTAGYGLAVPGYWRFGLPGFILGIAAGAVIAHLVLLSWVPVRRSEMFRQTVIYTVIFGLYGGLAVAGMKALPPDVGHGTEILAAMALTLVPCGIAGALVFNRLRAMRRRS